MLHGKFSKWFLIRMPRLAWWETGPSLEADPSARLIWMGRFRGVTEMLYFLVIFLLMNDFWAPVSTSALREIWC